MDEKKILIYIREGVPKIDFEGNWSRYELDRMYNLMLRQLPLHKRELAKKDMEERNDKRERESAATATEPAEPTAAKESKSRRK